MKRHIITTGDGSKTIQIEAWNEQYHSIHGAIQEAKHVFIVQGLHHLASRIAIQDITILEIGFGTGLNAYLTALEAKENDYAINYVGVEAFPVDLDEISQLNYTEMVPDATHTVFNAIHEVSWEEKHQILPFFSLTKQKKFFSEIQDEQQYNIIYFDAFGPRVQPELWTEALFEPMYNALTYNGVLVTYSAKGSVKRAMQKVGFDVERLQGPPGKRHMLRATKTKRV